MIEQIPLIPKIDIKDNPRPSFTEDEYKHFLKTTRKMVKEGVKVRGDTNNDGIILFHQFYGSFVSSTSWVWSVRDLASGQIGKKQSQSVRN